MKKIIQKSNLCNLKNTSLVIFILLAQVICGQEDNNTQQILNRSNTINNSGGNGMNVDVYRGVLNFSVPLYVINGREMNFPISINYSASGIKVDQVASNVGLGWNLNVGGGIARIVNATPDDRGGTSFSQGCTNLFSEDPAGPNYMNLNYLTTKDYYKVSSLGLEEVLQSQRNIIFLDPLLNENRIVEWNAANRTDITIQNEDGTKYFFNTEGEESTISSSAGNGCIIVDQIYKSYHHLTKVISKNGLDTYRIVYDTYTWSPTSTIPNNGEGEYISDGSYKMITSSFRMIQKMPTAIYHNDDKIIEFEYGDREDLTFTEGHGNALIAINILKFKADEAQKKIIFDYTYFGQGSTYLGKRLKLDKIKQSGFINNNEIVENLYEFNYDSPGSVPSLDSYARDYLGLFNGKINNANLILDCDYNYNNSENYDFNFAGSNRSYSFIHSTIGTLNKIIYPNKGYTLLEYEQNKLATPGPNIDSNPTTQSIDGFRIKSITNLNYDDTFVSKKVYKYLKSTLNEYVENGYLKHLGYDPFNSNNWEVHKLSRSYINPSELVHYKNVLEMTVDSNDNHNGFSQYLYSDAEVPLGESRITPICNHSEDPETFTYIQGYNYKKYELMTNRKIYNKNLEVISETNYNYERVLDVEAYNTLGYSGRHWFDWTYVTLDSPYTKSETLLMNIESDCKTLQYTYDNFFHLYSTFNAEENETITYEYLQYPYVSKITSSLKGETVFNYNDHNFPHLITEIKKAKSTNHPLETVVTYTYDQFGNKIESVAYTPGTLTPASYESYIYGYENSRIVAKLTGVKYADISSNTIIDIKSASKVEISNTNDQILRTLLDNLRAAHSDALVTTYTYNPVLGITSVTDPKDYTIYYEYDALGRLKYTKEKDKTGNGINLISENQYHTITNP